ncbi:MAG: hypothetical protein N3A61_03025 [Ignavibacteria bacterium]|nr:hypothetical protein [Ignavibacteria bacterium]
MQTLNIKPFKSKETFRKNYELHDKAVRIGEDLLKLWKIGFQEFGSDKRYERVWEKGKDKPDLILFYDNKNIALLDWKAKRTSTYILNKRAYQAYNEWHQKFKLPVVVAFILFNNKLEFQEAKFVIIPDVVVIEQKEKVWDKNIVVKINSKLFNFTRENLLKNLGIE